jgi:hypothetical protein
MPLINTPLTGWLINGVPTEDTIPANSTISNAVLEYVATVTALTPLGSTNIDDPTRFDASVNGSINDALINAVVDYVNARFASYTQEGYGLVYITDIQTNITNYSASGGGSIVTTSVYQTAKLEFHKNTNVPAESPSGV